MTTVESSEWKRFVPGTPALCAWAVLLAVFGLAYYETIWHLLGTWYSQPDYQHCFFVPLFSLYLLWHRRDMADPLPTQGSWWALPMFVAAALIRWATVYFRYNGDHYSLFPLLIGVTLFVGGWRALRWAWPSIAFMIFIVPLPGFMEVMLGHQLQRIATTLSVFVIQTCGIPAVAEGNVIDLATHKLNVVNACSGIKMLMLFFAVCVGAAFVVRRPLGEKLLIVVSSIPIAVISNVGRISIDGILTDMAGPKVGDFFHVWVGWIMMIFAMLLLWGEMALISKLLLESPLTLDDSTRRARGDASEVAW